jgi:pyridoxamine 5'-phosphate oxidase
MALLPEPLPADPLPLLNDWLREARAKTRLPNWNSMALATVGPDQHPSVRIVLCKELVMAPGYLVFYTNYQSPKARDIDQQPRVAAVFYWNEPGRQVRVDGVAVPSPTSESDQYFSTRDVDSRLGAWASQQSQPIASRKELLEQFEGAEQRFCGNNAREDAEIPRPPAWGGYRLWLDTVELWVSAPARMHDRGRWQRELEPAQNGAFAGSAWVATRLQP